MDTLNQRQAQAYEARIHALFKANKLLMETLKGIQDSLSLDDSQQRSIHARIQMVLDQLSKSLS